MDGCSSFSALNARNHVAFEAYATVGKQPLFPSQVIQSDLSVSFFSCYLYSMRKKIITITPVLLNLVIQEIVLHSASSSSDFNASRSPVRSVQNRFIGQSQVKEGSSDKESFLLRFIKVSKMCRLDVFFIFLTFLINLPSL